MTVIVQLSDPHFGTEVPMVVDAVQRAVKALGPEVVLVSGDITQRARTGQFRAAAEFMRSLHVKKFLVVPGNHDIPLFNLFSRVVSPYGGFEQAFGRREFSWFGEGVAIVGLDATSPWRHTDGELDIARLRKAVELARQQLEPGAVLLVCAHQPLHTAWPEDNEQVLIGADKSAAALSGLGVDMVLSGHVHVPLISSTRGIFNDLPRHFLLAGAGTAVSHRTRPGAPNSFNVIRLGKPDPRRRIVIEKHCFDSTAREFSIESCHSFESMADGWVDSAAV